MSKYDFTPPPAPPPLGLAVTTVQAIVIFRGATNTTLHYSKEIVTRNIGRNVDGAVNIHTLGELISEYYNTRNGSGV